MSRTTEIDLPRWDVSGLYPSPASREFVAAHELLGADVTRLTALFDQYDVRGGEARTPTEADLAEFDDVTTQYNVVSAAVDRIGAYVYAFVSTDSRNDAAQGLASQLDKLNAALGQLSTRYRAWVAMFGAERLVAGSVVAADHAYPLDVAAHAATHQMDEGEESLYADLHLTGSSAWYRLHGDMTSQLEADVLLPDGTTAHLPVTAIRALATDPDPATREAAYRAEVTAWETIAVPLAAALNAIKGEALTVNTRRRWSDPLEPMLHHNHVDRPTLDAMTAAVVAALPDFRRYLHTKARLHGYDGGLRWWDLAAPLPQAGHELSWDEGCARVLTTFSSYSDDLGSMADRAMQERWIDVAPRAGKRGGAFCMSFFDDRSLVLLNWDGSLDGVQTLAHELGHAYHNVQLSMRTPLQKQVPMALAETASIFCETLSMDHNLAAATGTERLGLLDIDLQSACAVVVDIHSRFLFETEVFRRRAERPLSVTELCEAMTAAQRQAYGDGLDEASLHPYMWAVKGHYYSTHYYNWPYTYGLLFGLGLFARYQDDPERFRMGYDDLLSACGMASAADLGARFGIDVRSADFWTASLDVLRGRIDEFERLAAEHL